MAYRPYAGGTVSAQPSDYLDDVDPETLLRDPRFLQEYREMRKRQSDGADADDWTEQELIEDFYTHQAWVNNNSVAAAVEWGRSQFAGDEQKRRMARIQRAWEQAPTRDIDDGSAWSDYASSLLVDPLNAVGVGFGLRGAFRAAQAGKGALAIAGAGARSGAAAGAIEGAGTEVVIDALNQGRFIETGLQDEFSLGRSAASAGAGAAFGAGLGGVMGGAAAGLGARGMRRTATALADANVPADRLNSLNYGDARALQRELDGRSYEEAFPAPEPEALPDPTTAAPAKPETPFEFDPTALATAKVRAEEQLDELHRQDADPSLIRAAERNVATMTELQRINELRESFKTNTDEMLKSDDSKTRGAANRNVSRIVRLESLARRLMEDPSLAQIEDITRQRVMVANDLEVDPSLPQRGMVEGDIQGEKLGSKGQETRGAPEFSQPGTAEEIKVAAPDGTMPNVEAPPAEVATPASEALIVKTGEGKPDEKPSAAAPERSIEDFEAEEEAQEVFDVLMNGYRPMQGAAQFRDVIEHVARAKYPERADRVMEIYDSKYDNPNGIPSGDYAKIVAAPKGQQEASTQAPARAAKRRAAKAGKKPPAQDGLPDVTTAMATKSMAEQLRDAGLLGNLVRDDRLIRGSSAGEADAFARSAQKAADEFIARKNANQTAEAKANVGRDLVKNPQRSATGRAGDVLRDGPTTAGRAESGRPQAILRGGQATERDIITNEPTRTITDGTAPRRGGIDREAFELESATAKEIRAWTASEPMTDVIGGTSRSYTTKKGKEKRQKGYVPRGKTVFYSPFTQRYYTSEADALAASGRGPARPLPRITRDEHNLLPGRVEGADGTPEATATAPTGPSTDEIATWTKQLLSGELSPEEFQDLIRGASRDVARASDNPREQALAETKTPVPTEDRVPAVRRISKPDDVRVLSDKQIDGGVGVEALIGRADPDDFEVGYVARGARSFTKSARDSFQKLSAEEANELAEELQDAAIANAPMSEEAAKTTAIDLMALSSDEFAVLQDTWDAVWNGSPPQGRLARDHELTVGKLEAVIGTLEVGAGGWSRLPDAASVQARIEQLANAYAIFARAAPNGIETPTATKLEANKTIEDIFEGHDPKEIAAAHSFIVSLAGDRAPVFVASNRNDFTYYSSTPDTSNKINIATWGGKGNPPKLFALMHETAHWAYKNILTPQDRLEFWRGIQETYYSGPKGWRENEAIKSRSLTLNEGVTNGIDSPQEFFANQFVAWVGKREGTFADEGFWTRMWNYMRAIFNRFAAQDFIDPSLEPLFAKIIPDPEEAARFRAVTPRGPLKSKQSQYIVSHINTMNVLHDDLARALRFDQPETAIATAEDMAEFLFKMTARGNTFAAIQKTAPMAKLLRDTAYKIAETLNMRVDEDLLDTMSKGDFDDADIDAADIWLRENEPEGTTSKTDPTKIVDALRVLFKGDEKRGIDAATTYVSYTLNRAFKRNEGYAFSPEQIPNAYRAAKEWRETPKTDQRIRGRKDKAKAEAKTIEKQARELARTPPSKRKPTGRPATSKTKSHNVREMTFSELMDIYRAGGDTDRASSAMEMLRRMKADPDASAWGKGVPVTEEIKSARIDAMQDMLMDALDEGDPQRVEQILYETWRRGENQRRKKLGRAGIMPVVSRLVTNSIEREAKHSLGMTDDGIIPGASTVVQEIQSFMSHRDPEVQSTMRTLVYRALNLKGKTVRNALDSTSILTTGDVYRLAGKAQPPGAAAVFADFRSGGFSGLRGKMRTMAIGLTKDVSDPFDVMHEVHHLALRTGLFDEDDFRLIRESFVEAAQKGDRVALSRIRDYAGGRNIDDLNESEVAEIAEEWFAEQGAMFSMGKVAKGDLFAIREGKRVTELTARSRLVTFANHMIDAAAYLVNGLIGRKTIKQMFRRIDNYGDMFASKRNAFPPASSVAPEYAAAHYSSAMASMSIERVMRMREFVGSGLGSDGEGIRVFYHGTPSGDRLTSPDAVMQPGSGDYGRAIYVTSNPKVANEVYANRATRAALKKRAELALADGVIDQETFDSEVMPTITAITSIRREISRLALQKANLSFVARLGENIASMRDIRKESVSSLDSKIAGLREYEEYYMAELDSFGVGIAPTVVGSVVRAKNPANFRANHTITKLDPMINNLLLDLEENGLIDFERAHQWQTQLPERGLRGPDMHQSLVRLVAKDPMPSSVREAVNAVTDSLGRLGYDSIHADLPNTLNDGSKVWHESVMLIDHVDTTSGRRVLASNNIKSIDAKTFDETDVLLYNSLVSSVEPPNSSIIGMTLDGRSPDATMALEVISHLDAAGAPPEFTRGVVGMVRGRRMNSARWFDSSKKFFTAVLSANSTRLEREGLHMPAEFHRNHYVDHANDLGGKVFTLRDILGALPDTPGSMGRWIESIKGPKAPDSHKRILNALRMGVHSDDFRRLAPAEQDVAIKVRGMIDAEYDNMRRAGVIVGKIENYFPQVWDVNVLRQRGDEFIDKLANYFQAEASRDGRRLDREEAISRANGVWGRLVDDEGHYIPPPAGAGRTATSDHIDYQRLIRLDDPEFSLNYKELREFLENDLEGMLIKYFDGTSRRILQTSRFGTMNHGYYDYLHVMDAGVDGVADLLSTNRVVRKDIRAMGEDGGMTVLEFRDEVMMPFKDDNVGSKIAARRALEIFQTDGAAAAKDFLMALDPNKKLVATASFIPPTKTTYEHRVDAIISALADGGGKRQAVPAREIIFAQDAMRGALRKQVGSGPLHTDAARDGSRLIRTFNAVSLLSFTVLTSLPDMVLPTIRSGKAGAHARALAKFADDPDYRRAIRNTGAAIESIVHQRMAGLFAVDISGKLGRVNNAFFNATLLTPWTDMQRQIAAATGFEAFKVDIDKAVRAMVGDGRDVAAQTGEFRRIMRRLNRYGLSDFVYNKRALSQDDLEDLAIKKAVIKFANESIFAPNPDDMPLWTQTPWGSIIWQLKSYPVMLGRMAADVVGAAGKDVHYAFKNKDLSEIDPDNFKSLAYLFTLGPAMGAAALGLKDVVQMRGGEDNREGELRSRNWEKFMGYSKEVHGDKNDFAGWYAEGLMAMGGMGLLADILHTTVENADNGAYGGNRVLSAFMGPSVGTAASATTIVGGVIDKDPESNGSERAAWREAIRRVPFIGGMGSIREGMTDAIAGAPAERGGGGGSEGFGEGGLGGEGAFGGGGGLDQSGF